jgi:hypothetical protein
MCVWCPKCNEVCPLADNEDVDVVFGKPFIGPQWRMDYRDGCGFSPYVGGVYGECLVRDADTGVGVVGRAKILVGWYPPDDKVYREIRRFLELSVRVAASDVALCPDGKLCPEAQARTELTLDTVDRWMLVNEPKVYARLVREKAEEDKKERLRLLRNREPGAVDSLSGI